MKKILLLVLCMFIICSCSDNRDNPKNEPLTYKEIMETSEYVIIDVRTKEEYEEGHIKDAINIPYDEIDDTFKEDKEKTIFVYCRSGQRASIAAQTLTNMGYNVINLGGYDSIDLEKE